MGWLLPSPLGLLLTHDTKAMSQGRTLSTQLQVHRDFSFHSPEATPTSALTTPWLSSHPFQKLSFLWNRLISRSVLNNLLMVTPAGLTSVTVSETPHLLILPHSLSLLMVHPVSTCCFWCSCVPFHLLLWSVLPAFPH